MSGCGGWQNAAGPRTRLGPAGSFKAPSNHTERFLEVGANSCLSVHVITQGQLCTLALMVSLCEVTFLKKMVRPSVFLVFLRPASKEKNRYLHTANRSKHGRNGFYCTSLEVRCCLQAAGSILKSSDQLVGGMTGPISILSAFPSEPFLEL